MLTQERLKELLVYNKDTGTFTANADRANIKIGDYIGNYNRDGYFRIMIDGISYLAHRLVWLYIYGVLPEKNKDIDHKNRIRHDNRLCNLRIVSRQENLRNSNPRDGSIGIKGITWDKSRDKWYVQIGIGNGKTKHLGRYDDLEDAIKARKAGEDKYWANTPKELR